MTVTLELQNFYDLALFLERYPGELEKYIPESFSEVEMYMLSVLQGKTPVDTGKTRSAWTSVNTQFGLSFTNPAAAAKYLEEGLYKGVGPKTVATEKGIFSTQAPEGIINPILKDQAVLNTMAQLFFSSLLSNLRWGGEL